MTTLYKFLKVCLGNHSLSVKRHSKQTVTEKQLGKFKLKSCYKESMCKNGTKTVHAEQKQRDNLARSFREAR